ncbi:hypothetical protein N9K67_03160, partial [Opitutaceae bacterium]|nr:hypothetical protein [Opitutaceae bacterium]
MPTIRKSLDQITARKPSKADKVRLEKLAEKSDAEIDFSDQPNITDAAIKRGTVRIVGRGGKRPGAGRPALGKTRKSIKLSPSAVRRLEDYARRKKLPHFSAAVEAASELLERLG